MVVRWSQIFPLAKSKDRFSRPSKWVDFMPHVKCPSRSGKPHLPRCNVFRCSLQEVRKWHADFEDELGTTNPCIASGGEAHQNRAWGERIPLWKGPALVH